MQLSSFLSFESEGGLLRAVAGGRSFMYEHDQLASLDGLCAPWFVRPHALSARPGTEKPARSNPRTSLRTGFLSSTWNSGMAGSDRLPVTIFVQPPSAMTAGGASLRAGNTLA